MSCNRTLAVVLALAGSAAGLGAQQPASGAAERPRPATWRARRLRPSSSRRRHSSSSAGATSARRCSAPAMRWSSAAARRRASRPATSSSSAASSTTSTASTSPASIRSASRRRAPRRSSRRRTTSRLPWSPTAATASSRGIISSATSAPVTPSDQAGADCRTIAHPGRLILGAERRQIGGAGDFMVLDRGSDHGLRQGQQLTIFRRTVADGPVADGRHGRRSTPSSRNRRWSASTGRSTRCTSAISSPFTADAADRLSRQP